MTKFFTYGLDEAPGQKGFTVTLSSLDERRPLKFNAGVLHNGRHVTENYLTIVVIGQHLSQVLQKRRGVTLARRCFDRPETIDNALITFNPNQSGLTLWPELTCQRFWEVNGLALGECFPRGFCCLGVVAIHYERVSTKQIIEAFLSEPVTTGHQNHVDVRHIDAFIKNNDLLRRVHEPVALN